MSLIQTESLGGSAGGGGGGGSSALIALPVGVTGILSTEHGGTGSTLSALASQDLIIGTGATTLGRFGVGTDGQALHSVGSSLAWHKPFFHPMITGVSTNTYGVTTTDRFLNVSSGVTSIIITLLSATFGIPLLIKDIGGTCSANNITVRSVGTEAMEGIASTLVIQTNYGSKWLFPDQTNIAWWMY